MKTEHMLPICEKIDKVGYHSLEMFGGATFDSMMRFLDEDPWERVETLRDVMPKTRFQMLLRAQNIVRNDMANFCEFLTQTLVHV
jgi:pyruvate/oxaloacetate carboxyltransferase